MEHRSFFKDVGTQTVLVTAVAIFNTVIGQHYFEYLFSCEKRWQSSKLTAECDQEETPKLRIYTCIKWVHSSCWQLLARPSSFTFLSWETWMRVLQSPTISLIIADLFLRSQQHICWSVLMEWIKTLPLIFDRAAINNGAMNFKCSQFNFCFLLALQTRTFYHQ